MCDIPFYIILGGKYEQLPLIEEARRHGFKTICCDMNEFPAARSRCDVFCRISYRDIDAVVDLAHAFNVEGIGTIGTNDAIVSVSEISYRLGIHSLYDKPEIIRTATYKHLWRPLLKQTNIAIANGHVISTVEEAFRCCKNLHFPVIIKPVDSSGCKGVRVVRSSRDLSEALTQALSCSDRGTAVIEEFLGHNSFAVESYVSDGRVHLLAVGERTLTPLPLCVGLGVIIPANQSAGLLGRMAELNERAIRALSITNGPVHIDMVVGRDDRPFIVDIGPRLVGGPLGWENLRRYAGFDCVRAVFEQSIGKKPEIRKENGDGRYFAHRYLSSPDDGELTAISVPENLIDHPFYLSHVLFPEPGDRLKRLQDSGQRLGYVIAGADNYDDLTAYLDRFEQGVIYEFSGAKKCESIRNCV